MPRWFHNRIGKAISKKRQAMNRSREKPTALNKTKIPEKSQKPNFSNEETKFYHFSDVLSDYTNKPKQFYKTLNEIRGKESVKTNH